MPSYNPDKLIQIIEEDHIHGADWLSNAAIGVLITASLHEKADNVELLHNKLWDIGVKLASTRPSMASLTNKISYLFNQLCKVSELSEYRSKVCDLSTKIINSSKINKKLIAKNLKSIAGEVTSVFTYSYSGTVIDVIREVGYKNIVVTESRPMMEGKRLARELGDDGYNVILTVDGAIDMYINYADICLIGADSIQYNGSAINKVGSKLLGYAAKDKGIPFYVLCDTYKFNVINYLGGSIELEEKNPDEVSEPYQNVEIKNPYFEVIPPELISGVITEEGLMRPVDIKQKIESMRGYVEPIYLTRK
jgi:translation initiation factor eIF-2B subunit delta